MSLNNLTCLNLSLQHFKIIGSRARDFVRQTHQTCLFLVCKLHHDASKSAFDVCAQTGLALCHSFDPWYPCVCFFFPPWRRCSIYPQHFTVTLSNSQYLMDHALPNFILFNITLLQVITRFTVHHTSSSIISWDRRSNLRVSSPSVFFQAPP